MSIKHLMGTILLVAALTACGKGKAKDKGGGDTAGGDKASGDTAGGATAGGGGGGGNADVDAFMKLDTDKGVAFAVGGEDCVAKAKSVGDWRTAHTAEYKALQAKLNAAWTAGPPADVLAKYGDQMKKNKDAVMQAMMACSSNEEFGKMMDATKTD